MAGRPACMMYDPILSLTGAAADQWVTSVGLRSTHTKPYNAIQAWDMDGICAVQPLCNHAVSYWAIHHDTDIYSMIVWVWHGPTWVWYGLDRAVTRYSPHVQLFVPHYYQSKMSTGAVEKAVYARAKLLENDEGQPLSAEPRSMWVGLCWAHAEMQYPCGLVDCGATGPY